MDAVRLFIGLELTEQGKATLAGLKQKLESISKGRLTDPGLYHMTLHFLGQVPCERMNALIALLDGLTGDPFTLSLGTLGTFKNGSILWIGAEEPSGALHALHAALADALISAGFEAEREGYTPHITLGRSMRAIGVMPTLHRISIPIHHVTLFESTRIDGRLVYLPRYRRVLGDISTTIEEGQKC